MFLAFVLLIVTLHVEIQYLVSTSGLIYAPFSIVLGLHLHGPKVLAIHLFHSFFCSALVASIWIYILFVALLQFLSLLFFPLEDVRRNKLNELIIEHIQNLAANELQLGLLTWQIVVHDLHHSLS